MLKHHINVIVTAAIGKGVYATLPTVFTANDTVHWTSPAKVEGFSDRSKRSEEQ